MAPAPPFRLGPWQVGPKVLGVLVHLASRPGEVVSREERPGGPGWLVASVPALGGGERRLADLGPRRPYGLDWSEGSGVEGLPDTRR